MGAEETRLPNMNWPHHWGSKLWSIEMAIDLTELADITLNRLHNQYENIISTINTFGDDRLALT